MKLSGRVLGIFLVSLFAVATIGCGTDTEDIDDVVETVDSTTAKESTD